MHVFHFNEKFDFEFLSIQKHEIGMKKFWWRFHDYYMLFLQIVLIISQYCGLFGRTCINQSREWNAKLLHCLITNIVSFTSVYVDLIMYCTICVYTFSLDTPLSQVNLWPEPYSITPRVNIPVRFTCIFFENAIKLNHHLSS